MIRPGVNHRDGMHRKRINISTVLAGQGVGIRKSTKAAASLASWTASLATSTSSRHPATARQPVRNEVVTCVSGTACDRVLVQTRRYWRRECLSIPASLLALQAMASAIRQFVRRVVQLIT